MKTPKNIFVYLLAICLSVASFQLFAKSQHLETASFKVYGNCSMCKKRIETAVLKNTNVKKADWDVSSKILTVVYDPHSIQIDEIHKIVAEVGHDTEKVKATDSTYKKLMSCCQYKR